MSQVPLFASAFCYLFIDCILLMIESVLLLTDERSSRLRFSMPFDCCISM